MGTDFTLEVLMLPETSSGNNMHTGETKFVYHGHYKKKTKKLKKGAILTRKYS